VSQKRPMIFSGHNFSKCLPIFKMLSLRIQQEICSKTLVMFSTTPQLCSYTTLWNLKCDLCYLLLEKRTLKFIQFIYLM